MTETTDTAGKRLVQLIPADGWVAFSKDEHEHTVVRRPLVAWALRSDGEVVPLTAGPEGTVGDPRESPNFDHIQWAAH